MTLLSHLKGLKSTILIALDLAKAAENSRDVLRLANQAADLEAQIARELITAQRPADAVVSLISQASCLEDAGRYFDACEALVMAAELTTENSVLRYIHIERERLNKRLRATELVGVSDVRAQIRDGGESPFSNQGFDSRRVDECAPPKRRGAQQDRITAFGSFALSVANGTPEFSLREKSILELQRQIHRDLLAHSRHVREPNFAAVHPQDLEFLFDAYDQRFLHGRCRDALAGSMLQFRLSPRIITSTSVFRTATGDTIYQIAVASSTLFDCFQPTERKTTVYGIKCEDRLEALQRIFEHELVHLIERLCWNTTNCSAARFQNLARRLFLHQEHIHSSITRRERAVDFDIRPGSRVAFVFEGRRLVGRVKRVTKRATVLVEDPNGQRHSDGLRYRSYYVPLAQLEADFPSEPT
jgi:hypothetical protein